MNKCNFIETTNGHSNLGDKQNPDKLKSIKLKTIAAFDYFDKTLIVLSATSVIGVPVEIASASFSLVFSLTRRIIKY